MTLTEKFYKMYNKKMSYNSIFNLTKNNIMNYPKNEAIDALYNLHAQVSCDINFGYPPTPEYLANSEALMAEIYEKIEQIKKS